MDELLAQYGGDESGQTSAHARNQPWFVLQDAGGDVVAVAGSMSSGLPVSVAGQYTYDAYGEVQTTDHLAEHPLMHVGHKGLFFDRLDVPLVATGGMGIRSDELPRLVPYASGLYQMRNRAYSPQTGCFMQRDPNATSMVLIESASMHGRGIGAAVAALSPDEMYGDGHNLYQYLGSNPMSRRDPLGLSWDPFDMVDEIAAEHEASISAFMSQLGRGAVAAASMAATIMTYLPFPAANIAGELAKVALGEQSMEEALEAIAIGLIPGGKLLGAAGKVLGKVGSYVAKLASSAWSAAKYYAGKFFGGFVNKVSGLARRAYDFVVCGVLKIACFAAGTTVWTEIGSQPIEQIEIGQFVQSVYVDDNTPVMIQNQNAGTADRTASIAFNHRLHTYDSPDPDDYASINPHMWRQVELTMDSTSNGTCTITLLRPLPWIEKNGVKAGQRIQLSLSEIGVHGLALVKRVGLCPPIKSKPEIGPSKTQLVIGTFKTTNALVINLFVEDLDKPISTTASHLFYSIDRRGWIAAGDLKPGETLRTAHGARKVTSAVKHHYPRLFITLKSIAIAHTLYQVRRCWSTTTANFSPKRVLMCPAVLCVEVPR